MSVIYQHSTSSTWNQTVKKFHWLFQAVRTVSLHNTKNVHFADAINGRGKLIDWKAFGETESKIR